MLPLVTRELRVSARNPKLYQWRVRIGIIVLFAASGILFATPASPSARPGGNWLFWFISGLALLFCLLEGIRKTADSISEEKRDGTLGFLFLTDLHGWDIVLGKICAAAIRSLNGLLAFLPLLALTLLQGGITGGEFTRMALVLLSVMTASLALCIFVSSLARTRPVGWCIATLAALCLLPYLIAAVCSIAGLSMDPNSILAASPLRLYRNASEASQFRTPLYYWIGIAVMGTLTVCSTALASFAVTRSWQDKVPRKTRVRATRNPRQAATEKALRDKHLDENPLLWLFHAQASGKTFRTIYFIVAALGICAAATFSFLGFAGFIDGQDAPAIVTVILGATNAALFLLLCLHIGSHASASFAEGRRNGTFELILSTPVTNRDIIAGLSKSLMFTSRLPLVILAVSTLFLGIQSSAYEPAFSLWFLKSAIEAVLSLYLLSQLGMWMGLTAKSSGRAFFNTIALGLIAPFIVCTPTILNQVILIVISRQKVERFFHKYIADIYLQTSNYQLVPVATPVPLPQPPNSTPPVLR